MITRFILFLVALPVSLAAQLSVVPVGGPVSRDVVYRVAVTSPSSGSGTVTFFDNNKRNDPALVTEVVNFTHPGGGNTVEVSAPSGTFPPGNVIVADVSLAGNTATTALLRGMDQLPAPGVEPSDFDQFWNTAKAELAAVPPNYQITRLSGEENQYYTAWRITADVEASGATALFYMAVPKVSEATGVGLPAAINYPAFGNTTNDDFGIRPSEMAERAGVISLAVSIHEGGVYSGGSYSSLNLSTPEDAYMKLAVKRCLRAVDFVEQLDDTGIGVFDGSDIMVWGESQGGGLSKIVAGLRPDVISLVFTSVDAFTAHGYRPGHASGFPYYVENGESEANAAYFDAYYHAKRIEARKVFTASTLRDDVAPSTSHQAGRAALPPTTSAVYLVDRDAEHASDSRYSNGKINFALDNMPTARTPWPFSIGQALEDFEVSATVNGGIASASYRRDGVNELSSSAPGWRQVSGPGTITFGNPAGANTGLTADQDGTYVVEFTAVDEEPDGESAYIAQARAVYVEGDGSGEGGDPPPGGGGDPPPSNSGDVRTVSGVLVRSSSAQLSGYVPDPTRGESTLAYILSDNSYRFFDGSAWVAFRAEAEATTLPSYGTLDAANAALAPGTLFRYDGTETERAEGSVGVATQ